MQIVPVLALFAFSLQPLLQPSGGNPVIPDVNGDAPAEGMIARLGTVRYRLADSPDAGGPRFRMMWGNQENSIALSRDAKLLVARSEVYKQRPDKVHEHLGTRLRMMDLNTGKIIHSHVVAGLPSDSMHFAPDGQTIIFSSLSEIVSVDAKTGKIVTKLDLGPQVIWNGQLTALSHDGKLMAKQLSLNEFHSPVLILDLQTGKNAATLPGRGSQCRALAFAPDGKRLLLASITPSSVGKNGLTFGVLRAFVWVKKY